MEPKKDPTVKPRDAHAVQAVLHSMGVDSYDPRVVNQLLELLHRYVSSILTESRLYSEHADKSTIDLDDIRLAIRSKCSFTFTQPPPREVTMRLAAERNSIPLPPVEQHAGIALPPPQFQLTAQNYRVLIDRSKRPPPSSPPGAKHPRLASPTASALTGGKEAKPASSPASSGRQGTLQGALKNVKGAEGDGAGKAALGTAAAAAAARAVQPGAMEVDAGAKVGADGAKPAQLKAVLPSAGAASGQTGAPQKQAPAS